MDVARLVGFCLFRRVQCLFLGRCPTLCNGVSAVPRLAVCEAVTRLLLDCQFTRLHSADMFIDLTGPGEPAEFPRTDIVYSSGLSVTLRYMTDDIMAGLLPALAFRLTELTVTGEQRHSYLLTMPRCLGDGTHTK